MANRPEDPFAIAIRDATSRVVDKGTSNATANDVILAGFGWLAGEIRSAVGNGSSRTDKVKRMGPPAAAGGGLTVVLLELAKLLSA